MSNTFIQEAFKQFYLTEDAEEFSLNVSGPDDVESFLDIVAPEEDEEVISDVYDLEAEAKEDLKQSYLGKVILDCNVCHSNVFFNKDEITENEDGLCCVDIECPYCMSNEGYTIIGEVKPYQEEGDVDIEDIETEEVPEEPVEDVEIDIEETEEKPEAEEEFEESVEDVYAKARKLVKGKKVSVDGKKGKITDVTGVSNIDEDESEVLSVKNINTVEVTFDDGEEKDIDVEDLDSPLTEGLKADEVKELRGNEEINGADGPIAAVDELEGSDEIRGPKYKELDESLKVVPTFTFEFDTEDEALEFKRAFEASEFGDNYAVELVGGGAVQLFGNGTFDGNAAAAELEDIVNAFDNFKFESVTNLKECGEPDPELEEGVLGSVAGGLAGAALGNAVGHPFIGAGIGAMAGNAIQNHFTDQNESLEECGDPEAMEEGVGAIDLAKGAIKGMANEITEDIEDVSINTEDENITMTTKEDGGVVVETSPKEDAVVEDEVIDDAEMIAPLEPETEADIEDAVEMNDDEEEAPIDDFDLEDVDLEGGEEDFGDDFEEFDEESFDNLGESYLKRCYENVTSFKTSNITLNENKEFIIEGKIGFDSGNVKDTQFVFSKKSDENGKLKLEGYNKQISTGKKTFKLNCSVNDKSLVCESLNYNYKGKNDLNESVRVYGTVKRK